MRKDCVNVKYERPDFILLSLCLLQRYLHSVAHEIDSLASFFSLTFVFGNYVLVGPEGSGGTLKELSVKFSLLDFSRNNC